MKTKRGATRRRTSCRSEKTREGSGHIEHGSVEIYTARLRRAATREMKVDGEKKSWKEETKK